MVSCQDGRLKGPDPGSRYVRVAQFWHAVPTRCRRACTDRALHAACQPVRGWCWVVAVADEHTRRKLSVHPVLSWRLSVAVSRCFYETSMTALCSRSEQRSQTDDVTSMLSRPLCGLEVAVSLAQGGQSPQAAHVRGSSYREFVRCGKAVGEPSTLHCR